jgi:hypothetical protein
LQSVRLVAAVAELESLGSNMDSILKSFSISILLRSLFSGVFFVMSYYVASHDPVDVSSIDGKAFLALGLPFALFAGVTTYGIHRSLIYPCVESCYDSDCGRAFRKRYPLIRVSTIRTLLWRWSADETIPPPVRRQRMNRHFNTWADYIHLQYASAQCIVFGAIAAPGKQPPCWFLIGLVIILFLAALISDWRTHSVLDYIRNEA